MNFEKAKEKAKQHALLVKQREQLRQIKHKNDPKRKVPTHKLITAYLFIVLNIVLIYALVSMWHFADLTHLGVIVTDIIGQIATFLIYSHHSTAQNTSGGIVYETVMEKIKNGFHSPSEMSEQEKNEAVG